MSAREHVTYAWDKEAAKKGEEKPIKRGDHSCDAARYVVNAVFNDWRLAV
jgi:phage terminase large subunit